MPKIVTIEHAPEVERLAEELIENWHPHLAEATILYLETNAKTKCQPVLLGPF